MIYECPQCQMPQAAGQTVCPHCHAEFDGPVPDDAIVLPGTEAMPTGPEAELAGPEAEPAGEAAVGSAKAYPAAAEKAGPQSDPGPMPLDPPSAADAAPPVSAAPPPATSPPPVSSGSEPYLTPPSYAPPPYTPPVAGMPYAPAAAPFGKLTRVLLIAFPVVFVLVLLGVYFAGTLNTEADTAPEQAISTRPEAVAPPPPAPVGDPVLLQGGSNTNDGSDPRVKLLAGRWTSKADTFYVFNADGTGSRGSTADPSKEQSFLWGLVQNRLMLYGSKNEALRFSTGPDNDTVYLAPQTGHAIQYSRVKTQ